MANNKVEGELYASITGQLFELGRQLRQKSGYPFDPNRLRRDLQNLIEGKFKSTGLLIPFGTPTPMKAVKRFVVADHFKVGNKVGGLKIGGVGGNFVRHFLSVIEEDVPQRTLPAWTLAEDSLDQPIVTVLGGEQEPAMQTHLAHLFQTMELGKRGPGLWNDKVNIGYKMSPVDASCFVVYWHVHDGILIVEASPVSDPHECSAGSRVFGGDSESVIS